jgi:small-conductance mechanosensitive channel
MNIFATIFEKLEPYMDIINLIIVIVISFIVFSIILKTIKKYLLKKVKRKKLITSVITFLNLLKLLFIIFLFLVIVFVYYGNLGELGFVAGLLTIAIGMALQKPISGVFAWLIIITRKPFGIGDRIIISNTKGDVTNVSMSHIYLDEVGGTVDGEEKSNRSVILPTSIIFEQEVINYNEKDDYILDEVIIAITYESNFEKAEKIMNDAVGKILRPLSDAFQKKIPLESHTRLKCKDSGIDINVRYYSLLTKRNEIASDITREILRQISKTKDVEIAYPHTQLLFPINKKVL